MPSLYLPLAGPGRPFAPMKFSGTSSSFLFPVPVRGFLRNLPSALFLVFPPLPPPGRNRIFHSPISLSSFRILESVHQETRTMFAWDRLQIAFRPRHPIRNCAKLRWSHFFGIISPATPRKIFDDVAESEHELISRSSKFYRRITSNSALVQEFLLGPQNILKAVLCLNVII